MGVPALFALGTWIVGDGLLAARLAAWLAVSATAALLFVFLDHYARLRLAGVLAALFYLAYMTRPEGLAANTEVFNNLAATSAMGFTCSKLACTKRFCLPVISSLLLLALVGSATKFGTKLQGWLRPITTYIGSRFAGALSCAEI